MPLRHRQRVRFLLPRPPPKRKKRGPRTLVELLSSPHLPPLTCKALPVPHSTFDLIKPTTCLTAVLLLLLLNPIPRLALYTPVTVRQNFVWNPLWQVPNRPKSDLLTLWLISPTITTFRCMATWPTCPLPLPQSCPLNLCTNPLCLCPAPTASRALPASLTILWIHRITGNVIPMLCINC